ncbi:MAG: plasmid recombination protein, partial [Spirochaetales bacterium]|nr:plasmid recombination protein [Spirochaetales bacterium]
NDRIGAYDAEGKPLEEWITRPEYTEYNELHSNPSELEARRKRRLAEAALKRKPQKNAAYAVEVVVSASPDWFDKREESYIKSYFDAALASLGRRYGAENVLGYSTHYDETTPHMHVLMVPLVEGKDGWRYSSSAFIGGRADLAALHDQLARDLAEFGVTRGERGSEARHTDQRGWQRDLARKERELAKREKNLARIEREKEAMWAARESELAAREAEVNRVWGTMAAVQQEAVKKRLRREDREEGR